MPPTRIIPVEDIPLSLWDQCVLRLPPSLAAAYRAAVTHHRLGHVADARDSRKPPVGGVTQAEARTHFAQAFDGSSARVTLALLDPHGEVTRVADALAVLFAGGKIAVLDVPCGAGAFFLSVLATVAELREVGVVPRQPLDVVVLGGDVNSHAVKFAHDLHQRLEDDLKKQAITVNFAAQDWDVTDDVSTAALLKRFIRDTVDSERTAVVVSNFSGFLESGTNRKKAEPQLKHLFMYCPGNHRIGLWLEPQTKAATATLVAWLDGLLGRKWKRVMKTFRNESSQPTQDLSEAEFVLPLKSGVACRVRLDVKRFDLLGPSP